MTTTRHQVFITTTDSDSFLVASIDSPRFAVSAETKEAALEKAQRILKYYYTALGSKGTNGKDKRGSA